jgi:CDP-paratose 2-epimerase
MYLITGGCGFVGSNLAAELLRRDEKIVIIDNLTRNGAESNLAWLQELGAFAFQRMDIRNTGDLEGIFRDYELECVFHLAGQVAMTTSLENPRADFDINVAGSMNVLECLRRFAPGATYVYASSNKVYRPMPDADLRETATRYEPIGNPAIDEQAPLEFLTPYGCSKGAADQYALEYARNFGQNTVVFRHSTIYGGRQHATFEQGWVGWFCRQALATVADPEKNFTISGDGKQVRDLLHVSDAVACYISAHQNIAGARGQAFNIGGGVANSMSLRELFAHLEAKLGVKLNPRELPFRANDQKYFVADNTKAGEYLSWRPEKNKEAGIADALAWEQQRLEQGPG